MGGAGAVGTRAGRRGPEPRAPRAVVPGGHDHPPVEPPPVARVDVSARLSPETDRPPTTPMLDRRFTDDEVREILARATEVQDRSPSLPAPGSLAEGHERGLTLAELQDVASEVGIPASRIADAARAVELDQAALPPTRTQLGVPISAGHVVHLSRMPKPDEWDRFVVRLRDTFDAVGTVRTEGSLQTWSNGNLTVLLEPQADGARLRFQSLHSASKGYLDGGIILGATSAMMVAGFWTIAALGGKPVPWGLYGLAASFLPSGAAMWARGRSRAGRWLPERRGQFRALGEEAVRLVGKGAE